MTQKQYEQQVKAALDLYGKAGIALTEQEKNNVEVIDFGKGMVETLGLQILVYVNTQRVCAKEMALTPGQTCAEHMHIPTDGHPGKEETFRCRYGKVFLYVAGDKNVDQIQAKLPPCDVSAFHEIVLKPGDQYTIMPETMHWFQAGSDGAVVSEFSTRSTDETDVFYDKSLIRSGKIEE